MNANKICPQCGKSNLEGKRFCVQCGTRLDQSAVPAGGRKMPAATQERHEAPQEAAFSQPGVIDLLQQIIDSAAAEGEPALQEQRIARLVQMGPDAVPAAVGAVWSTLRYGDREPSRLRSAGSLCEAIGRMGGEKAFDALARFVTHESTVAGYARVRAGALRGLGYLDDRRAESVIVPALEDPDAMVRDAAAWALEQIHPSNAALQSKESIHGAVQETTTSDQPVEPRGIESAGQQVETVASAAAKSSASAAEKKASAIFWLGIAGAVAYVGMIVLVFFVPQIPFGVGTLMLLPGVLGLILARGGSRFFDRHPSGCMWIVASLVGGLILYGLLWLFQRSFFLSALESV